MIELAEGRLGSGTIGWHVTEARNVGAIKRWGLIPRDTGQYHYPDEAQAHHGVEGVYVLRGSRPWWVTNAGSTYEGAYLSHALRVDVSGLLYRRDFYIGGSLCILERITPDRILDCIRRDRFQRQEPAFPF